MQTEFEFISKLKEKYSLRRVGDDCAVLPSGGDTDLVVTADMLVENVDFRMDWTSPNWLGHKALAVSLSDIAAMGAQPAWAMVSFAVPAGLWNEDLLGRFYEGWTSLAAKFGVELVGGDISRTEGPLVIDSIAGGSVPRGKAILRSGAQPGDSIYVSGFLGGAACGLKLLEQGQRPSETAEGPIGRQLHPQAQITLGNWLQTQMVATSMIDVSDGISSDLAHVCAASSVGARLLAEALPIDPELNLHFGPRESLDLALHGGEDFELLFTSPQHDLAFPPEHRVTRIGEVTANSGIVEIVQDGVATPVKAEGYRHF